MARRHQETFFGTITDPSGSAVANAKVTITSLDRGTVYTTVSNDSGNFEQTQLLPGRFSVDVQAPGFQRYVAERCDGQRGPVAASRRAVDRRRGQPGSHRVGRNTGSCDGPRGGDGRSREQADRGTADGEPELHLSAACHAGVTTGARAACGQRESAAGTPDQHERAAFRSQQFHD